jgi:hypothetical protein
MRIHLHLSDLRSGQRVSELTRGHALVGRGPDPRSLDGPDPEECDLIALDARDPIASRNHFRLDRREHGYFLTNMSRNGTRVNGEAVSPHGRMLYHGDAIEAGHAEITYVVSDDTTDPALLFEDGTRNEKTDPAYAAQCYYLAHVRSPRNPVYAAHLLRLIEETGKLEGLLAGAHYGAVEEFVDLAGSADVAVPLARSYLSVGDYQAARSIIERAGGADADPRLGRLLSRITRQTQQTLVTDYVLAGRKCPFFQRDRLRIYIEERLDFVDLRFIERYSKFLQHLVDPRFGGPPRGDVVFHVTARDVMFADSVPGSSCLGYYSHADRHIYLRPRRWIREADKEGHFHEAVVHEYVHFRVHDLLEERGLPRWYNEGVAQLLSNDRSPEDFASELSGIPALRVPIRALTDELFFSAGAATGYWVSHAVLSYLARTCGQDRPVEVLTQMRTADIPFTAAFENVMGFPLAHLDSEWWNLLANTT